MSRVLSPVIAIGIVGVATYHGLAPRQLSPSDYKRIDIAVSALGIEARFGIKSMGATFYQEMAGVQPKIMRLGNTWAESGDTFEERADSVFAEIRRKTGIPIRKSSPYVELYKVGVYKDVPVKQWVQTADVEWKEGWLNRLFKKDK